MDTLFEWLTPALSWFLTGLLFLLLELMVPSLVLIFFGIGAWVTAIVCLNDVFAGQIAVQFILFTLTSIFSLNFLRQRLKTLFYGVEIKGVEGRDADFIGKNAEVTNNISSKKSGRVSINGSTWKAVSSESLVIGEVVRVLEKNNLTLKVESHKEN